MRKSSIKKFTAVSALIFAVTLMLTACSNTNKFRLNDDGQYVDKKNNIAYIDAPACYEPIAMGEELYGEIGSAQIYEIVGADPERWLCESTGSVFYASDVTLPALDEMDISYVGVTMEDVELVRLTDDAVVSALICAYSDGAEIRKPTYTDSMLDVSWRLKFADEGLGIYYVLNYIELTEDYTVTNDDGTQTNYGRKFIFNRFEDKCVVAGDALAAYVDEYKTINEANG